MLIHLKRTALLLAIFICTTQLKAQKVDYKDDIIKVDGKEVAKVVKIKDKANMGLTSTYELHSLKGEKLIIAAITTEFEEAWNDNSSYYYRFSFLTADQTAIFALGKLSTEKSFAKLIGQSGIVVNDSLDYNKLAEFIATKSRNPKRIVNYDLVRRNMLFPVFAKPDNSILQGTTLIGKFKDMSKRPDVDTYEFMLPDGLIVARISFRGGNNARNFIVHTSRDNYTRAVILPDGDKIMASSERNLVVLQRLARWLVEAKYL